jgi:DNA invertase Pin-like site-specific DNA recombinase
VRISQDRQGLEAGVQRQQQDSEALIAKNGWEPAGVWSDNDISASRYGRKRRVEYQEMLAEVEAGAVDVIVAYHPKRLVRQTRELEDLIDLAERTGVRFEFVTLDMPLDLNTATGRAMARVAAAFGAMESEEQSERIRRQRLEQVEQGRRQGGGKRPFGFEADGVTHRPEESAAIRQAAHDLLTGASLYRVSQEWNARGLLTPAGNPWSTGNLSRLMRQVSLAGVRRHERTGTEVEAAWKPIITPAEHQALKRRLSSNGGGVREGRRRALLSGIARCAVCGSKLLVTQGRYICDRSRGRGCGETRVAQGRELEAAVYKLLEDPRFRVKPKRQRERDDVKRTRAHAELASIEERAATLAADYGSGTLTRAEFNAARAAAARRREEVERELAELGEPSVDYVEARDDAYNSWLNGNELTSDEVALLQEPLRAALPGGAVYVRPARWARVFDPSRLELRE